MYFFASREIPNLNSLICAATDEGLPIEAHGDSSNKASMACEGMNFLARGQIPLLDHFIHAAAGNSLPIGADDDSSNRAGMTSESMKQAKFFGGERWYGRCNWYYLLKGRGDNADFCIL